MIDEDEGWKALAGRDGAADGRFVYAVVTTGIYCRPSCPTPTPLRRNVRFFADNVAAEVAGFCACKRCRPNLASPFAWQATVVGKACAILHASEQAPPLAALAVAVGVSRFHFHRIFKGTLGVTPGEYAQTVRWRRLATGLASGSPVAEAVYGAGYGSMSRAYAKARQALGMTPAARRAGGAGVDVRFAIVEREAGCVLVATTTEGVCAIEIGPDPAELTNRLHRDLLASRIGRHDPTATIALAEVVRRAELPLPALELQPEFREVAFRTRIRKAVQEAGLFSPAAPRRPAEVGVVHGDGAASRHLAAA